MVKEQAIKCKEMGDEAYKNQKYPEAIDQYQASLDIDPTFSEAWYCLGSALEKNQTAFSKDLLFCYEHAGKFRDSKERVSKLQETKEGKSLQLYITLKTQENIDFWDLQKKFASGQKVLFSIIGFIMIIYIVITVLISFPLGVKSNAFLVILPYLLVFVGMVITYDMRKYKLSLENYLKMFSLRASYTIFLWITVISVSIIEGFIYFQSILYVLILNSAGLFYYFIATYDDVPRTDIGIFIQKLRIFYYSLAIGDLGRALYFTNDVKWIFRREGIQIENWVEIAKQLNTGILNEILKNEKRGKKQSSLEALTKSEESREKMERNINSKQLTKDKKKLTSLYPRILYKFLLIKDKIHFSNLLSELDLPEITVSKRSMFSSMVTFAEIAGKILGIFTPSVLITIFSFMLTGRLV